MFSSIGEVEMKITQLQAGNLNKIKNVKSSKTNKTSEKFSVGESDMEGETHAVSSSSFVGLVESVLYHLNEQTLKEAVDTSHRLLDDLENLRVKILSGNISESDLWAINDRFNLLESQTIDPNLNEIVLEIRTRAAVEMAKLEMSRKK